MTKPIVQIRSVSKVFKVQNTDKTFRNYLLTRAANIISKVKGKGAIAGRQSRMQNEVLSAISFDVFEGDCIGIIGKNGSGKSTLLRIIAGITHASLGTVEITGKVAAILEVGTGFHPELSGRQNIYFSARLYGMTDSEIELHLDSILGFSGIGEAIDQQVKNYSTGMYLRLAFAIVIHVDADIYLFDEIINVGDTEFQLKCQKRFRELKSAGKTILWASHNLNQLSKVCNRILILDKGKLVDIGGFEIISRYLEDSFYSFNSLDASNASHYSSFTEDASRLKNSFISIRRIDIKAANKSSGSGITIEDSIEILIEYKKTDESSRIDIGIQISDIYGNPLIGSCTITDSDFAENTAHENYSLLFSIPSILSCKAYTLDVYIIKNKNVDKTEMLNSVLAFKVIFANQNHPDRNRVNYERSQNPIIPPISFRLIQAEHN